MGLRQGYALVQHFFPRLSRLYVHHNMPAVQVRSKHVAAFASLHAALLQLMAHICNQCVEAALSKHSSYAGQGTAMIAKSCCSAELNPS